MKQIRLFVCALLLQLPAFAGEGIQFVKMSWAQVKAKALKEKKMIFLDAFASWCGPCKYMEENIYTDKNTADYFNQHFINVKIDMELGEGPALSDQFEVSAYPTFLFFTPDGKLVHKSVGALDAEAFTTLGKNASDPSQQFFTLKNRARAGTLNDASFLTWVEQADKMEDPDMEGLVKKYLEKKTDRFANKEIVRLVLYHSPKTEEMVRSFLDNRTRLKSIMGWDQAATDNELYDLVFSYSLKAYTNHHSSVDSFMASFRKMYPERADIARADILYRIEMYVNKDAAAGMNLLIGHLSDEKSMVPVSMISNWLIDHEDAFGEAEYEKFYSAIKEHQFRASDKGQECWIYLMQMLGASKNGDLEKAKAYALKAYQQENLPEVYKAALRSGYDLK